MAGLTREGIVRAALDALDEVGLDGLTVRVLAGRLGVRPGALYWHFRDKRELLDEMATTLVRDLASGPGPQVERTDWAGYLRATARSLRAMLLAHRDGARMFSGRYLTDDAVLARMEEPLGVLTDAGMPLAEAVLAWLTLYDFVIGFVIEEQAVRPRPDEPDERYQPDRRAARIDSDRFPLTHEAGATLALHPDARFDHGVDLILRALSPALPDPPA